MTRAIYETNDGFVYVGYQTDDDTAPPPLSPLLMSTEAVRQWLADHPEVCESQQDE